MGTGDGDGGEGTDGWEGGMGTGSVFRLAQKELIKFVAGRLRECVVCLSGEDGGQVVVKADEFLYGVIAGQRRGTVP